MNRAIYYGLYGFAIFVVLGWFFVWIIHLTSIIRGKFKLYRKVQITSPETPLPGVSVLKPLVGIDPNLFTNIESFFTMNYFQFELLFCVHDANDASLMVVKKLMEKYPQVNARIFIGGQKIGVNPKINNMFPGYEAAKYDLVLISDSGLKMREDTLLDMVLQMKDDVALVNQLPFSCDRTGFPSILEKVYFGTAQSRIALFCDTFGINCTTGMSALMRKKVLDEAGGLRAFGQYLAEDYFFAQLFMNKGWKLSLSTQPALQNSANIDIDTINDRLSRWAKLRIAMIPILIFFEPLSECLLLGAVAAWAVNFLFQIDPFGVYLFHVLLWFLLDYVLLNVVQNGSLPFSKTDFVIAWLFRECFVYILFLRALWYPEIKWRTGTYRLKWGGYVEEVKTKL